MQTKVPAAFKNSGAPVTPPAAEPQSRKQTPATAWKRMTLGDVATTPIHELLQTLGVRIVETPAGELEADGITGYFAGQVGDGEIQIEQSLPQSDREAVVRSLLARITPQWQNYNTRRPTAPRLVPVPFLNGMVHVECPDWCVLDHLGEDRQVHLEDVDHSSERADLAITDLEGSNWGFIDCRINVEPFSGIEGEQAPHLLLSDETNYHHLTPEQGLKLADDLVAFAAKVRHQAERAGR
ncbi:DUF6907 domain-containing protein [Streptomyces anulatus]|uniref:DUF6907 domain-containing protein n=1 Tax=Streptomyces anulatus TaxID=1892 RepID=UPI0038642F89|nr:hypothetical protein OHB50_04210 [Streptomyces anulatus]